MNLRNVPGLPPDVITRLEALGVTSVEELALTDPEELAEHVPGIRPETARLFKIRAAGLLGAPGATATRHEIVGARPGSARDFRAPEPREQAADTRGGGPQAERRRA